MNVPRDLFYTATHEWVRFTQDGFALAGLTDHAQETLGDIAYVNLTCAAGDAVNAAEPMGEIESIKAVTDIFAPVSGTVAGVNAEAVDHPEQINTDPYGAWLVKIGPYEPNPGLLDAVAYELLIAGE